MGLLIRENLLCIVKLEGNEKINKLKIFYTEILNMKIVKIPRKILKKILLYKFRLEKKLLKNKLNSCWLGTSYGGFFVNLDGLNKESIIYSFGIGEDISFDSEIIDRTGAEVYGFDPTPKSINWVNKNKIKGFNFYDYGIGTKDGEDKLFLPKNPNHVSGSVFRVSNVSGEYIKIKLKTLQSIMNELGHSKIDVLKLDIEGLEYDVLKNILREDIQIGQILVEFHDRFFQDGKKKREEIIKILEESGFILFAISNSLEEYSFMKSDLYNELSKRTK